MSLLNVMTILFILWVLQICSFMVLIFWPLSRFENDKYGMFFVFVPIVNHFYALLLFMRIVFPIQTIKWEIRTLKWFEKEKTIEDNLWDLKMAFDETLWYYEDISKWKKDGTSQENEHFFLRDGFSLKKAMRDFEMHPLVVSRVEKTNESTSPKRVIFTLARKNTDFIESYQVKRDLSPMVRREIPEVIETFRKYKDDETIKVLKVQYEEPIRAIRNSIRDSFHLTGEVDGDLINSVMKILNTFVDAVKNRENTLVKLEKIEAEKQTKSINEIMRKRILIEEEYVEMLKKKSIN